MSAPIVLWRANAWHHGTVKRIEVERLTVACYWTNGRRRARVANLSRVFPSFDEAKAWLVGQLVQRVASSEHALVDARTKLAAARALTPDGAA